MDINTFTKASDNVPSDTTPEENDIIRHNWTRLGYEQWFTDYSVEYWKHPDTNHTVTLCI